MTLNWYIHYGWYKQIHSLRSCSGGCDILYKKWKENNLNSPIKISFLLDNSVYEQDITDIDIPECSCDTFHVNHA